MRTIVAFGEIFLLDSQVVDASTSGARKVSIQLGLTIVPENISKGELMAQKENRRKVRAVLAGGLVLGVGVAVTLAAWNDSEFTEGIFGAGHFNMQGSANGEPFSDHAAGNPAELSFAVAPDKLSPGDIVTATYELQLDAKTTNAATVSVNSGIGTGLASAELSYGIDLVDSVEACEPGVTGTEIVPAGTAFTAISVAIPGANTFPLAMSSVADKPGTSVVLCVQVKASENLAQDTGAVGTWEFVGESVS